MAKPCFNLPGSQEENNGLTKERTIDNRIAEHSKRGDRFGEL
jgi:hypothetical protein